MLQEKTPSASPEPMGDEKDDVKPRSEYELIDLDLQELRDRYSDVLRQAYMLDEARAQKRAHQVRRMLEPCAGLGWTAS